jgi:hypothetical protein
MALYADQHKHPKARSKNSSKMLRVALPSGPYIF